MSLKFEIENMELKQRPSKKEDNLFCSFLFTTPEWKSVEKYAIFWNRQNKSTIKYLGTKRKATCPLPESLLSDLYFYVQIYSNESIQTKKVKVYTHTMPDCYHKMKRKKDKKIAINGIDDIKYENNQLLLYANGNLQDTIDIIDDGLIQRVLSGFAPEFIIDTTLSPNSTNPLANKTIYLLLNKKIEKGELSPIAFSGSFNDLIDVPDFAPLEHTHDSEDINDLENSIEPNLNNLLEILTNELKN